MLKKLNLKAMSFDDLLRLRDRLTKAISSRAKLERRELETRLARLNDAKLAQPTGTRRRRRVLSRKRRGKVAPKYRNSAKPYETWTGRGRQPLWMTAAIKAGKKRDSFLIK
jgi:DNA-binding protein H-NS